MEVRASSNLARITGPARERSFLTDGNNHAIDFSYLEDFTRGMHRLEVNSVLRYTDDIRTDPERNSVQRAYFRINGPRSEYNFGDYLVNYSSLTYNQNLKGFHFIQSAPWGQGFRLLGNAGTFTDRYGSLFREELPGKPFTRVVSGLRAEQTIDRDKMIALNWSYGNDIAGSLPGTTTFRPVVANNVASLDARMTFFNAWNLEGEIAYSSLSRDTRKRIGNRKNKDYALRFDNSVRKGPWNFNVYFTRIMPSFFAVNARQVADLQDLQARASVQLGERVSLQGSYRRTNNDLRGQNRRPETVFQMPDVRLSLRVVGNTLIDMGYKERHQDQFGSADRVTQTPFFQIGIPISSSVLSFGFEHRIHLDRLVRSNQTSSNDFSVGFRSIFNAGDWMFTPLLRYELNREIFDRVDTGNNNRNIQAGLILDAPRYFVFEAMFRQVGATLFQDRRVLDPNGLPVFEVTGPSGFRRPAFHLAVTYKLLNDENRFITLSYERNNNLFALPGQDFLEKVMQATVVFRSRRQ